MKDKEFVKHHLELYKALEKAKDRMCNDFEYNKSAFLYEMYNHEYGINWQADYDVLSCFGDIHFREADGDDLPAYFDELQFTDTQRNAYMAARQKYFKENADMF